MEENEFYLWWHFSAGALFFKKKYCVSKSVSNNLHQIHDETTEMKKEVYNQTEQKLKRNTLSLLVSQQTLLATWHWLAMTGLVNFLSPGKLMFSYLILTTKYISTKLEPTIIYIYIQLT
jgi:hypothetical protein